MFRLEKEESQSRGESRIQGSLSGPEVALFLIETYIDSLMRHMNEAIQSERNVSLERSEEKVTRENTWRDTQESGRYNSTLAAEPVK